MRADQVERLAGRLVELRTKQRRRSVQVLIAGMERISGMLDAAVEEDALPAKPAKLPDFVVDSDDDYPDQATLDALEDQLGDFEGDCEPQDESARFNAAFQAVSELPDRVDEEFCRLVAEALVCLRELLGVKQVPADDLDTLEDNLEDPPKERKFRWGDLEAQ